LRSRSSSSRLASCCSYRSVLRKVTCASCRPRHVTCSSRSNSCSAWMSGNALGSTVSRPWASVLRRSCAARLSRSWTLSRRRSPLCSSWCGISSTLIHTSASARPARARSSVSGGRGRPAGAALCRHLPADLLVRVGWCRDVTGLVSRPLRVCSAQTTPVLCGIPSTVAPPTARRPRGSPRPNRGPKS